MNVRVVLVASACTALACCAWGAPPSFSLVGISNNGENGVALSVSDDGRVVVGGAGTLSLDDAFRWTRAEGFVNIGSEGGYAVGSGNGLEIFGELFNDQLPNLPTYPATSGPARWLGFAQWEVLGGFSPCDATNGWMRDANTQGTIAVGGAWVGQCQTNGYLYRAGQPPARLRSAILLGGSSVANATSDDGSVIVGFNNGPAVSGRTGVYWVNGQPPLFVNGNFNSGELSDVSPDGRWIVGRGWGRNADAFRFDRQTSTVLVIPTLGGGAGNFTIPSAVSADGKTVVGQPAFIWREGVGTVALQPLIEQLGITIPADLPGGIGIPTAMSPDARYIVGWGPGTGVFSRQSWIFDRGGPDPCLADFTGPDGLGTPDGGVAIEDLLFFLEAFAAGATRADIDNGTSTGTPDGGVTIDDLLYFIIRFEDGC